jgi:hypothetical protein
LLRGISGPKTDKIIGCWSKMLNQKLHNLYSLPNITRIIKSCRVGWTACLACMGEKWNAYRFWQVIEKETDNQEE